MHVRLGRRYASAVVVGIWCGGQRRPCRLRACHPGKAHLASPVKRCARLPAGIFRRIFLSGPGHACSLLVGAARRERERDRQRGGGGCVLTVQRPSPGNHRDYLTVAWNFSCGWILSDGGSSSTSFKAPRVMRDAPLSTSQRSSHPCILRRSRGQGL